MGKIRKNKLKNTTSHTPSNETANSHDMTGSRHPNRMLFIENLPQITTGAMLEMLFQQFSGFLEVRMVPGRPGISFVEFDSDHDAAVAKNGLDKFRITPD